MPADILHIFISQQNGRLEKSRFDELAAAMPGTISKELYAYKKWEDAQASLAGKLLLKRFLQEQQLPFSLSDIQLQHKDRPFIDASFDFNISHSGDYTVLAAAFQNKVGIDIEKHRKLEPEMFRKYFSELEWQQIISPENPLKKFFHFWSVKEAAIKCDGRGVEVLGKTKTLDNKTVQCDTAVFQYSIIEINENYSCAVCTEKEIGEIMVKRVSKLFSY